MKKELQKQNQGSEKRKIRKRMETMGPAVVTEAIVKGNMMIEGIQARRTTGT